MKYTPTIGIECHVQLKTKTKLFAPVGNDAREAPPNTLISHICLGMPGALPVLNKEAVNLAIKAAKALKTRAQKFSAFDRKHYFYPDLPMGYQISQLYYPIILGGEVDITIDGETKKIGITRAHLEADAGKNTHPAGKDYSLVDLNRAGTPLLEIVSEPDMHSAVEAKAYARELYLLMKYADVSEADLYYGNMRFDINISISADENLGNRAEIKNLNSFRAVEKAVEYEIKRQTELLEKGEKVVQETRGWDDAKQKTFSQRSKEDAHDYRYMPDPDIPPVVLTDEYISEQETGTGESLDDIRSDLYSAGASESFAEDILEEPIICRFVLDINKTEKDHNVVETITQWVGQLAPKIAFDNQKNIADLQLNKNQIVKLSKMYNIDESVSSTQAKTLFEQIILNGIDVESYAKENGLLQLNDSSELEKIVAEVLGANQKAAEDVKNGEMKAIGFLVGQVMKQSGGKANPPMVQELIKKQLGV